jgi:hypothetical protein
MISKRLGERTRLSRTRGPFCSSFVGFSSKISGFSRISKRLGTKEEFELVFAVDAVDTVEGEGSSLSFDGFKSDLSVLEDVFGVGCDSPVDFSNFVVVEVDLVVEVVEVDDDVEVGNVVVEVGAVVMIFEVKVTSEDGTINDAVVEVGMVVVVVEDLIINFVVDVVEVEVVVVSSVVV